MPRPWKRVVMAAAITLLAAIPLLAGSSLAAAQSPVQSPNPDGATYITQCGPAARANARQSSIQLAVYDSSSMLSSNEPASMGAAPASQAELTLYTTMRKLWQDHMMFTYATVDDFFHNQEALQPTLNRLLQNQKDIGAAIVPFYGQAAGDQLAALLTTHIQDAVPVLQAAQSGDKAALKTATDAWYANAKEIADFLSAANPQSWPASATEPMMQEHITTTITYAVDLLNGNYAQSITDFGAAFDHMMDMSDVLSQGIIAQFPSQFAGSAPLSQSELGLYTAMRKLWFDHMMFTYLTVEDFFHNQDALQPTLNRLLQNQKDIGAAIVPFYGQAAGDQLAALLTTHIQDAVPVLQAAKSGDQAALKQASDAWYANAKQIADYLSAANPDNWPASATEPMMQEHISQTTTYSVDLLQGNYAQSITDFGKAYDHMMDMADVLSQGIIAQFPAKFGASGAPTQTPATSAAPSPATSAPVAPAPPNTGTGAPASSSFEEALFIVLGVLALTIASTSAGLVAALRRHR